MAGSRTFLDYSYFKEIIEKYIEENEGIEIEWITGRAHYGPDDMIYHYARWETNMPFKEFKAEWNKYQKVAGFIRNEEMSKFTNAAIIIWDGESNGTKDMISHLNRRGIPYELHVVDPSQYPSRCKIYEFESKKK